jgi:3-dehydroquinate synthase
VGIDHPLGKNLLGAFHAPEAVLIDTRYLNTLPEREYLQGMAEIIKTAVMLDRRFTRKLSALNPALRSRKHAALGAVIARCCALKGRVVAADPRESGYRRILNFGHTVGHALERASRFRLPHGFAVSIGMAVESGISLRLGLIGPPQIAEILELLESYCLPVSIPGGISRAEIIRAIAFDKKKSAGIVRFTLPGGIGRGICGVEVPMDILLASLER